MRVGWSSLNVLSHVEMVWKKSEAAESLKACIDALKEDMSLYIHAMNSPGRIQTGRNHPY